MPIALPRATPESVGIPSQALLDLLTDAAGQELHSLIVVRHGNVVAEGWWAPFTPERKHLLYSLSKSFMSTAIGLAIGEGRLTLDDRVLEFFPDEAPAEVSDNLRAMRVRDLLCMGAGHETAPLLEAEARKSNAWVRHFLAHPVPYEPGTHFVYNSLATFMLSAILQKLTGERTLDYLRPRLLDPLGISEATWEQNPDGIDIGGWGMSITTESIAKFGQLYLRDGMWGETRLLPEGWVAEASRKHIENGPGDWQDWASGYGFQFWRCQTGCYRGDGAFGQFCVVIPEADMVVAITACVDNLQAVLDLVWRHLLPACQAEPLPASPEKAVLEKKLVDLALPVPKGSGFAPYEAVITGKTYRSDHGAMAFKFDASGCEVTVDWEGINRTFNVGRRAWEINEGDEPAAAAGAWASEDEYVVRAQYVEEPYHVELRAKFEKGKVTVNRVDKGRFTPGPDEPFVGTA